MLVRRRQRTVTATVIGVAVGGALLFGWRVPWPVPGTGLRGAAVEAQELGGPVRGESTMHDFWALCSVWNHLTMVEAYGEVGKRDPAWDASALALLTLVAEQFSDPSRKLPDQELAQAADALAATQCDDPLVLYCVGAVRDLLGDRESAEAYVRRAVEGYPASEYPKSRMWGASMRLARLCDALGGEKSGESDSWRSLAIEWLAAGAGEADVAEEYQRVLFFQIEGALESELNGWEQEFHEAVSGNPEAHPWLASMVAGLYHISAAWEARGTGWADDVTEEGWKGFGEHLGLARDHLTKAWELHPEYPEAAAKMITVTAAGSLDDELSPRDWFDRAIAAQIDYPGAYDSYVYFLRPRWGGGTNEMYKFAVECLMTERFDTEVPYYYFTTVWQIAEKEGISDLWERPDVELKTDTLFGRMLEEPLHEARHARLKTEWAAVAWRGGRFHEARRLLGELGDEADPEGFSRRFYLSLDRARAQVYALTGPQAEEIESAEQLYGERALAEALALFEALQDEIDEPYAAAHIANRLTALRTESAFYGGAWVTMLPDSDLAGWEKFSDKWVVEDDGSVSLLPGTDFTTLLFTGRIEGDYEVRGEVELPPTGTDANATICLYYRRGATSRWVNAGFDPENGQVFVSHHVRETPFGTAATFHLQVWQGRAILRVNGESVLSGAEIEFDNPRGIPMEFALRGRNFGGEGSIVRFRNVEAHRLAGPPPGL